MHIAVAAITCNRASYTRRHRARQHTRSNFFGSGLLSPIGLSGPTESDSQVDSGSWVKNKSDSSVDSDSWIQTGSDSPVDSDSWVRTWSDSSVDSDSGTRARSDSGLDSGSWFGRAWGLAVGPPPARPPCYAPSRRGRMPIFLPVETHKL
jgi:hypothetical protein